MNSLDQLETVLTTPSPRLVADMKAIDGDIMLLGVAGKMGPTLARLASNADRSAGISRRIYGVSRFSSEGVRKELEDAGVETIPADLLDDSALGNLPSVPNVIYMAGRKFGTGGNEHLTWVMNSYLPGRVAEKFRASRIVVFSTGNVYPLTAIRAGGATESTAPDPVGEYGQSCLGRERVFEHFAHRNSTKMFLYRLNYAIDMRYGVLLEIARAVYEGRSVNLSTGNFNCIWQGDANEIALRALLHCSVPPEVVNVTGPETVSVRYVAERVAANFGKRAVFDGAEQSTALLSNAARMVRMFGYPSVGLDQMIEWVTEWVGSGSPTWDKPTHFQEREGQY